LLSETHLRKLILDILDVYGRVDLGLVGCLLLESKEAQINNGKILPPHEVIGFSRVLDKSADPSFAKAISDGIISEKESQYVSTYLTEQLARLDLLGSVNIFDLGTLSSNDSLVEWSSEYADHTFPIVSLPQMLQTSRISDPQFASVGSFEESSYQEIESSVNSNYSKLFLPFFIIAVGTFLLIFLVRGCFTSEINQQVSNDKQDILEVAEDDIAPFEEIDTSKLFNHANLEKYKAVLTTDVINEGCKIVVGSFESRENARKMEEIVLTEGYQTLIQTVENRSRVIITFDCLEEDLIDFLKEVQENVSSKSWYLSPRFEPEI